MPPILLLITCILLQALFRAICLNMGGSPCRAPCQFCGPLVNRPLARPAYNVTSVERTVRPERVGLSHLCHFALTLRPFITGWSALLLSLLPSLAYAVRNGPPLHGLNEKMAGAAPRDLFRVFRSGNQFANRDGVLSSM